MHISDNNQEDVEMTDNNIDFAFGKVPQRYMILQPFTLHHACRTAWPLDDIDWGTPADWSGQWDIPADLSSVTKLANERKTSTDVDFAAARQGDIEKHKLI